MGRKSKAKFKLKGHTLPGINQKSETSNLKDGRSPSSALQMQSPMKETTMPSYKGVKVDPTLSYKYKSAKIPEFRDFISLEQQQAYADKVDKRRADKKLDRQMRRDLKQESTPEAVGKRRDEMYDVVQEQQRKTLESQGEMEEEGRRLYPDLLEPKLQPLTLTEIEEKKKPRKKKDLTAREISLQKIKQLELKKLNKVLKTPGLGDVQTKIIQDLINQWNEKDY